MKYSRVIYDWSSPNKDPKVFGDLELVKKRISEIVFVKRLLFSIPAITIIMCFIIGIFIYPSKTCLIFMVSWSIGMVFIFMIGYFQKIRPREKAFREILEEIQEYKRITGNK